MTRSAICTPVVRSLCTKNDPGMIRPARCRPIAVSENYRCIWSISRWLFDFSSSSNTTMPCSSGAVSSKK